MAATTLRAVIVAALRGSFTVAPGSAGAETAWRPGSGYSFNSDGDLDVTFSSLPSHMNIHGGTGVNFITARGGWGAGLAYPGSTTITGGASDDKLNGGNGPDAINGGGADFINGSGGNDEMTGGGGNDALTGSGGNDALVGGGGPTSCSAATATTSSTPTTAKPTRRSTAARAQTLPTWTRGSTPRPIAVETVIPR